jgi:hypothetical protein
MPQIAHGESSAQSARSRGQAMVEFALVAPILFLLLFSIIEAGRFVFHYELLNNAARDGARYAITHGSNATCAAGGPSGPMPGGVAVPPCHDPSGDNIRKAVRDAAFGLVAAGDLTIPDPVYSGPSGMSNARGNTVTVSVAFTYQPFIPVLPPVTITAESSLVINN